jgi:hypothetical protein
MACSESAPNGAANDEDCISVHDERHLVNGASSFGWASTTPYSGRFYFFPDADEEEPIPPTATGTVFPWYSATSVTDPVSSTVLHFHSISAMSTFSGYSFEVSIKPKMHDGYLHSMLSFDVILKPS